MSTEQEKPTCALCGEPMPDGEEMFKYHGYSGPCPRPAGFKVRHDVPVAPPTGAQGETHMEIRKWLWVNHGCPVGSLYGDDGEMQCNSQSCRLDFKRADLFTLIQRTHAQQAEEIARLRAGLEREKERGQKHMDDAIAAESQVQALQAQLKTAQVEARVAGHGEGQMHAIADVNAGRIDDLIAPRLSALQAQLAEARQWAEVIQAALTIIANQRTTTP